MMNKKGLVGKIFSTPFVFIFLIIVLTLYLFLSASAYVLKQPPQYQDTARFYSTQLSSENDLLFKTIKIEVSNEAFIFEGLRSGYTEREMLVYDALQLLWINQDIDEEYFSPNQFTKAVADQLLNEENDCYAIKSSPVINDWSSWRFKDGKASEDSTIEDILELKPELLRTAKIRPRIEGTYARIITYYYGRCPDE